MLDVCLLGTGGMMPLPGRRLTALMTRYNGSSLLIDCGEGTQVAIKEKGWTFKPIDAKSRFFNLSFADGNIMVRVLESLSDFYKEGKLLHHCVFSNAYYKREDSLIMSATVDGRRMETVEFSLSRMEVCQCRGKSNQLSAYHDRILNLVRDNIPLIRERMVV